jgi:hypothetical protein
VQEAETRATTIGDVRYDRYEIWEGGRKVASGSNLKAAPL